jgi:two-component system, cell cycle sensor histidine kinase and response regulator CckA
MPRSATVLLVDDNEDSLGILEFVLHKEGFRVLTAASGLEGLELAFEHTPDLVLLDVMLPDLDGIEVCARIKGSEALAGVLVLLYSAAVTSTDKQIEGLKTGADGYVAKPADPYELVARIEALLRLRRTEAALGEQERQFRAVFGAALDAILVADDDRRIVDANPAAYRLFGLAGDELVGRRADDFVSPDVAPRLDEIWGAFLEAGEYTAACEIRLPDGSRRDVEASARARMLPGRHLAVLRDVTERRRAEKALRRSEERFRALVLNSTDVVHLLDARGVLLYESPAVTRVLGYDPEEMVGRSVADFIHPDDAERCETALASVVAYGLSGVTVECRVRHKDGSWRWVEAVGTNMLEDPAVEAVVINYRDISERRRAEELLRESEERLRQAQKLEAVGRLAGGVAHDFNNLLTVITGYCDLALRTVDAHDPLRERFVEIKQAGDRAADLTRQLLAFSRKQLLRPTVLDLNETIARIGGMLRRILGEDVELSTVPEPGLWRVYADPGQVEQVVLNLAANARHAMAGGGTLTIETANVRLDESDVAAHPDAVPGPHVMIAVSDTGAGMPAETLERIFEPFFTTKEVGKGTGLGLASVHGIVKQSGGSIRVQSEVGVGTTFRVYLPVARDEQAPAPPVEPRREAPGGHETILLVEDEPGVRRLTAAGLRMHGYRVLEAADGADALGMLEADGGGVRLLLTDVVMPKMSGPELARRVAELRGSIRVLFMSGHAEGAIVHHGMLGRGVALLQKPFALADLAWKVRQVLDEP